MGRNIKEYMKAKIINSAKADLPLYFNDFKIFWDSSVTSISDNDLYKTYQATLVFKNWKISLNTIGIKDLDLILNELFEDINSSFFLALYGQYRSAHMHMRSSIELSLQLLYFIDHPIEYYQWKTGSYIIKFDKLQEYIKKYPFNNVDITNLIDTIYQNWKYYSKHIHGESPIFFQCEKDIRKTNIFSKKDFGIWKNNFLKNVYNINKLFLIFFKPKFNMFPEACRNILIDSLKDDEKSLIYN